MYSVDHFCPNRTDSSAPELARPCFQSSNVENRFQLVSANDQDSALELLELPLGRRDAAGVDDGRVEVGRKSKALVSR